ncbi:hypothetical protein Daus18300_000249 [Diaporthe australafricana]|uniref:Pt repeat family protein n=1 Tax=Diaporthe australafricana TaxID=127596 RepID=A0ABR3Y4F9_9PEZI
MAWDASDRIRAAAPQVQTLNLSKFGLDESIFDLSNSSLSQQDANMTLGGLLSPIEEESGFAIDNAPLQVKVTVRFLDPAVKSLHYNRTYSSSPVFEPTDRICRGLLQRIEHCTKELITRNYREALNARLRRAPRFEINFHLRRHGFPGIWAERAFKSYQKHTITSTLAKDIIYSTHSIVCIFLRHHDKHFQWTNDPSHEHDKPTIFKPSLSGAPDLSCVPRSRFIEPTQAWETVPGYTVQLVFKSRNPSRRQSRITRTLKVNSKQSAPLNLGQGETLLWQAYRTLEDRLDSKRTAFEIEHASCDGFEGVLDCDCQHFDEDALCMELCVVNNLGPYYEHLHRDIQSRLQLFRHVCGNDCDDFVRDIHDGFDRLRDSMDEKLEALNDFDFRIAELVGHGWRVKNPARFTLDNKQTLSRRTIEALLDRIRTGVGHVLRGHDVAIRLIAHKRGHLILDKALIARNHQSMPGPFTPSTTPEDEQALFVAHLKARIQADIDLICKDTCSLEDVSGEPFPEHSGRPHNPPSRPFTPRSTCSDGLVLPKVRRDRVDSHHTAISYTPPGSPGHFTQPPVLPCVPPRSSSMRVFPLVPTKYKERDEEPRNTTPSEPDSAIAVDFDSDRTVPDGAVSVASSTSGRARPIFNEDHREDAARSEVSLVLSPAAEVFKRSEVEVDDWSSSRSTCSSMPALTESEMATPEHSLLITPSQMRHSSSKSGGLPFFNEFGHGEPSSPLLMATPDLADTAYPASRPPAEHEAMVPKTAVISTARPMDLPEEKPPATVSKEAQKPVETPNSTDVGSALQTQAHSQQPCEEDTSPKMHGAVESPNHEETGSGLCIIDDSDLAGHSFDSSGCESSENARHDLQHEGWLLHCVEDVDEQDDGIPEDVEYSRILASVAECDSSDTLRTQIRVLDDVIDEAPQPDTGSNSDEQPRQQLGENSQEAAAPLIVHKDDVDLRLLSRTPKADGSDDSSADAAQTREMSAEDELSRSKVDYFEADEDETDSEESQVHIGSLTPFSDSGVGMSQCSELVEGFDSGTKSQVLRSVDETAVEAPSVSVSVVQQSPPGKTDSVTISGPLISEVVRGGVQNGPNTASLDLNAPNEVLQAPDGGMVSDHLAASTPKTPTNGVFTRKPLTERTPTQDNFTLGATTTDLTKQDTSRTFAQTQPTTAHVGLKNNFLLPSLPVFPSLDSDLNRSRSSFQSSSSEWEDCVSEARQSSDSVDTIQQPPSLSDEDICAAERPGSPKRLGTPTAGILGLHESRWADFGIRGALTGSHAFDTRPSTAPMLNPDHSGEERVALKDDKTGEDSEETPRARPVSPHRKSLHLLHKKSISSIIFPGAHHGHQLHQHGKPPKLNKKESKELKAREKEKAKAKAKGKENSKPGVAPAPQGEDAGDAGRFPRAMMLVAGLAIASSVVNRTSG